MSSTVRTSQPRMDKSVFWSMMSKTRDAVIALGATANDAGLEPALLELVNLRCSQINGCAWCVQYHIEHLQRLARRQRRSIWSSTWQEAGIFSEREQAAPAWAETPDTACRDSRAGRRV